VIFDTSAIMQALAPGVALTSMIFYNGSLQSRMIFTVETIRKLNAEARELQAEDPAVQPERAQSIRWQVNFLKQRFVSIHRAILIVYTGLACFILTIATLLMKGLFHAQAMAVMAVVMFAAGFLCMGLATAVSSREIRLSRQTILEDIDSSHVDEVPAKMPPRVLTRQAWPERS
jgi:hypothetical protein